MGFTYTHHDPILNKKNRKIISNSARQGFIINLSANSLSHADNLFDTKCGPVVALLPSDQLTITKTPKRRKVVICPAITKGATCVECKLCARPRNFIIGFPAHGPKASLVTEPKRKLTWISRILKRLWKKF